MIDRRALALGLCGLYAGPARAQTPDQAIEQVYAVDAYSPARDPRADLVSAVEAATGLQRRILLMLGGDWCSWCHVLDSFMHNDAPTHDAMAQSFVIMKVNVSRENLNREFLADYPRPPGFPHFFVLETDGSLLATQTTGVFEKGAGYSRALLVRFARRWLRT